MSKPLSLLFAVVSMLLMAATAIALSYNGWLAALLLILTLVWIGSGFVLKARLRRRHSSSGE